MTIQANIAHSYIKTLHSKALLFIHQSSAKVSPNRFAFILGGIIFLAWLLPAPGAYDGFISLNTIAQYGIPGVFFFYGLRLTPKDLQYNFCNWKLHLLVQLGTFFLIPLIMLLFRLFFTQGNAGLLWLGAFYLSTLPPTVSSSVMMVSIAKGNVPAAIFNAKLSNLISILIVPLWMGLFLAASSGAFFAWSVVGKLLFQVIVPLCLGFSLHHRWGKYAQIHRKKIRFFGQSILLLIVYTSFSKSFAHQMFEEFTIPNILWLGVCMTGLMALAHYLISLLCKFFHINREDRISTIFCSSQKSLVHGTIMSKVLFPASNVIGIILLPLMLYSAIRMVVTGILAKKMIKTDGIQPPKHK